MSVLAEGFSVIVRRSTIESAIPGGVTVYKQLVPNKTFCADQHLTRVGFLDWPEVTTFLERLREERLTHHAVDGGPDVGVLHQDEGPVAFAPWLDWGRDAAGHPIAWLFGTDPGRVAVPEGWTQDSALRYIPDAEATERLIPLAAIPSHPAFLDSRSGEVLYGLSDDRSDATAALENLDVIKRLTDQLRFIRDRAGLIYVYYFPESWLRVIAQSLRLADRPDFNKHSNELQRLQHSATRIVNEGKTAFEAVAILKIDSELKESARLAYLQVFYDANWVILFCEYVRAMRDGNPKAITYFRVMADFSHKARANLTELQHQGARLANNYR